MQNVQIKNDLYVIPAGHGYSCLGFEVCKERSAKLAAWILGQDPGKILPQEEIPGTIEAYNRYTTLMSIARDICNQKKVRCNVELVQQLIPFESCRVEVVDKYGETRRFYVGKSTGWIPCHLEIARRDSTGGGSVTGAPFKSIRKIYTR